MVPSRFHSSLPISWMAAQYPALSSSCRRSSESRNPLGALYPMRSWSSAPKSITTFDRHGDTALLFEGFFDLLSYLTLQHKATPTADTAVLNSVVNLPRALPFLARHTTIHAFLDNDEAGRLTLERLRSALPGATVIDRAESYRAHKDLNESLRPSAKVSRTPRRRGRKL